MVDIDERVVQMKFDSSDFEQKSKNTLSILDKLRDKLSFKDAADNSVQAFNEINDNVQKMADKAYTIIDRTIDKIKDNIANKLVNFIQENTIGQFQKGWTKYADMTTSVATLKSQGYSLDKITEQLERLNFYTDETSYNFTDMVAEIGKFTASGQKLEDATQAMMGIANWAALSGKNASEASRAMYQLSQALGAGKIRKEDWKSIQNLNMDTKEFRENAIQAAIEFGTLKETAEGTYTTLVGKKANKLSFNVQQFAENLTEGEWFTADVMMKVFGQYSEAVDEIYDLYNEANENSETEVTASTIIRQVKEQNKKLIDEFKDTELSTKDINAVLARWKKVQKVTDETVDAYAEMNKLTKEQAREEMTKSYTDYLEEYNKIFTNSEKDAEEALEDWQTYISEFGLKALSAAQEARTFRDAIDAAKDAASTVWMNIYTSIFGNYEEAKELWTDLANALYDVFVARLSALADIFSYWKTGFEEDRKKELEALQAEYDGLIAKQRSGGGLVEGERVRLEQLKEEIQKATDEIESGLLNGRRVLFQGIYAFGSGFKSLLENIRKAWDESFEENSSAKKLFTFSERIRVSGFKFYTMMQELGDTDFFANIVQGIKNIFSPLSALVNIIRSVIGQFLPKGETTISVLVRISEAFKNLTAKMVPSQKTIVNIAKILRGLVAVFKFFGKVAYAIWITILKPIFSAIYEVVSTIISIALEVGAAIADVFFKFEEGIGPLEAMESVGEGLRDILLGILSVLGSIVREIIKFVAPAFYFLRDTITEFVEKIKKLFGVGEGGKGNIFENIAEGFKDMGARAKEAWTEGENLADVFNRFRGGTGIGNFIQMLGAMLDNLVTRIGRTILAIMGLDEEVTKSKIGEGIKTAKDIIVQAFMVIKWLYTNVIKPVFQLFFEGIKNSLAEVGEAFRSGDVNYMLTTLRNLIKTIGSLEIVQLIKMLIKVFGGGGLLKVLRNGAKALKGVYKYFSAKATNEMASALIKFAIALSIVVATMTALTFLPQENLEKLRNLLFHAGIAMMAMAGSVILLGLTMRLLHNPLNSITAMFVSMVAAALTTILVIKLMKKAFSDLWSVVYTKDENGNITGQEDKFDWGGMFTRIGAALLPIIAVFGSLLVITAIAKKLGAGSILKDFAISIMGLGVSIAALAYGLKLMVDFVTKVNFDQGAAAVLAMVGLILTMTLAGIALSRFSNKVGNWRSGLGTAIGMAGMVLSISLIVIPCLNEMVKNRDKFPQYVEALGVFALTMLSISSSFWLMTVGTKGGLHILAAGLVFNNVTRVVSEFIIPMLKEIQTIDFSNALSGIASIALLVLSISAALRLIIDGIANMISAISKINWKSWLTIISSTGLVVALIMTLMSTLQQSGTNLSITTILAPLGIVIGICVAFGSFVKSISRSIGTGDKTVKNVTKVFTMVMGILAVISLGIIGIIGTVGYLYNGNQENAMILIGEYALSVMLVVITLAVSFSKMVKSLSNTIKDLDKTKFERIKKLLGLMMGFLGIIMGGFALTTIGVGITYSNPVTSLAPLLGMLAGTSIFMVVFKEVIVGLFNEIVDITKNLKEDQFNNAVSVLNTILITLIALLAVIGTSTAFIGKSYSNGNEWMSIIAAVGIVAAVVGSLLGITFAFKQISEIVKDKTFTNAVYKKVKTIIIIMGLYIALLTTVLTVAINSLSEKIGINIANALIILGTVIVTTLALTTLFSKLINGVNTGTFGKNKIVALGLTFGAMVVITAQISNFFGEMSRYELLDWTTGLSFAIASAGFLVALGYAMTMILGVASSLPTNATQLGGIAVALVGMVGVIFAMSFIMAEMDKLIGVNWETAAAALAGIALIIVALAGVTKILMTASSGITDVNSVFGGTLAFIMSLAAVAIFAPFIFNAFKQLEGIKWDTIWQGLATIMIPFVTFFGLVSLIANTPIGDAFFMTSLKIAGGIMAIAAAAAVLAASIQLIKEVFGVGVEYGTALGKGVKKGFEGKEGMQINSPSKVMKKDAKYIAQGLALGLKQNTAISETAAENYANNFNDEFCDTLGIASPSKVFYENGRFVIRGFINGMNDEANKNKQAGADMASGFADGMDDVMEDMKNSWKGLWMGEEGDNYIKTMMEEGLGDLPDIFDNAIFGEGGEALTEAEENRLKELEELSRRTPNFSEIYADKYDELMALRAKKEAAGTNKLTKNITSSWTDAINNSVGGSEVLNLLTEKIDNLKNIALGIIGGEDTVQSIKDIFTGDDGVIDQISETTGIDLTNGLTGVINDLKNNTEIKTAAQNFGDSIGKSIYDGATGWVGDVLDWFAGTGNQKENEKNFQEWYDKNAESLELGYNSEKGFNYYWKVRQAIREFGDEGVIDLEHFDEYAREYLELGEKWRTITDLEIDEGFFSIKEGNGFWHYNKEEAKEIEKKIEEQELLRKDFARMMNGMDGSDIDLPTEAVLNKYFGTIYKKAKEYGYLSKEGNRWNFAKYSKDSTEYKMFSDYLKYGGYKIDYESNLKEIGESTNKLLTENGFQQEDFNRDQLIEIRKWMEANGLIDEYTQNISEESITWTHQRDAIISYLSSIVTNGLKIIDPNKTIFEKTTYDDAKEKELTLNYLRKLDSDARKGDVSAAQELNRLTGGLGFTEYMKTVTNDYNDLVKFMKTREYSALSSELKEYYEGKRDYYERYFDMREQKGRAGTIDSMTSTEKTAIKDYLLELGKDARKVSELDLNPFQNFIDQTGLKLTGEEMIRLFKEGWDIGWFELDQDGKLKAEKVTADMIQTIRQMLGINSPSRVAIEIMKFFTQGLGIGIDENTGMVINGIKDLTGLMTDTTISELEAMSNAIDNEDIQPTITPVYDDTMLDASAMLLNNSFNGVNNRADATVRSFDKDNGVNYNGTLAELSNQINVLTGVVNSFMELVESGDITTVNVEVEPVPDNIYNAVINTNRDRFKRTGRNGFMM